MDNLRQPLYYTFGNHMHWVDMEWLWGYAVLPDSARDMLAFCTATGAKGNLNFDGIGYEKMAVEAPEALAELRQAVARGQIEIVGASYGQPYGLFHGGESNIRQRVYGARTVRRLLGVWPRTFWEEEFDFFPQLPQILRGAGFSHASLFFQWTWHTPEVPRERIPAVWWEGLDGSRLLTATRNDFNLHQWPEDFALLLQSPALRAAAGPAPALVQWLELMPSPDWMCRAELMLPQLQALMAHPEFELRFATLSEYLDTVRDFAEPRRYTLDDVFHGMSLGKNGDLFRRLSRRSEQAALSAESLSALSGLFGRPYPGWDVYPAWELDEAWRELLSAQHHDNDECEGLCGHVGRRSYERSLALSGHVVDRTMDLIAGRTAGPAGRTVVFNPLGWARDAVIGGAGDRLRRVEVPAFGYRVVAPSDPATDEPGITVEDEGGAVWLRRGGLGVAVDRGRGVVTQITSPHFAEGVLRAGAPLAGLEMVRGGQVERFEAAEVTLAGSALQPQIVIQRRSAEGAAIRVTVSLAPEVDGVDLSYKATGLPRPDPRMHAALQTPIAVGFPAAELIHDHPYGLSAIRADGTYRKKYPTGDWMTSPQVFEEVRNPFTALQLLDFVEGERGLLYLHDGSQAFLRDGDTVRNILSMYDAWDEDYFVDDLDVHVRLIPHGALSHAARWRLAQEFTRPVLVNQPAAAGGDLPAAFCPVWCEAEGVALGAFFRESESSGAHLADYAGEGMAYPYVLRLVELNGQPAAARLTVAGPVAAAYKTNLLGALLEPLAVAAVSGSQAGGTAGMPTQASRIELHLRAHEIATLYLDAVAGRKQPRNLDDYRHIWATVHRVEQGQP